MFLIYVLHMHFLRLGPLRYLAAWFMNRFIFAGDSCPIAATLCILRAAYCTLNQNAKILSILNSFLVLPPTELLAVPSAASSLWRSSGLYSSNPHISHFPIFFPIRTPGAVGSEPLWPCSVAIPALAKFPPRRVAISR